MDLKWEEGRHSIGIKTLDDQHRELFAITNALYELQKAGGGKSEFLILLKRLHSYTNYHFSSEEGLFLKFEYPGTEVHKRIHRDFSEKIRKHFEDLKDDLDVNLDEVLDLLASWVKNHILKEDRKYAVFFAEQGVNINENFFFSVDDSSRGEPRSVENAADALWENQNLSLKIKEIDDQHRELVLILQQVNDLNKRGVTEPRRRMFLPHIIKKLYYYSQFHFNLEETLMARHHYPKLMAHKKLHQGFIDKINEFAEEYRQGRTSLNEEIVLFLKDWILQHILRDDADYKRFFKTDTPPAYPGNAPGTGGRVKTAGRSYTAEAPGD